MSLDTILQIGKVLRNSDNSLKYFKYIEPCPKDKDGNYPLCISIPINDDFSFDFDNVGIVPENERNELYYLKFKTSDSDGLVKYIFGDIFYAKKSNVKKDGKVESEEAGYYRLPSPNHSQKSYRFGSFDRGESDFKDIVSNSSSSLNLIRNKFNQNKELIERILFYLPAVEYYLNNNVNDSFSEFLKDKQFLYNLSCEYNYDKNVKILKKIGVEHDKKDLDNKEKELLFKLTNETVFLHFHFQNKKHWYNFKKEVDIINMKMLGDFVDSTKNGVVLKKSLYKTLCSGDKKNDIQFPGFSVINKFKSKLFTQDEIQNLFYGLSYSNKGIQFPCTNVKLIVLPYGKNLTVSDYEMFADKSNEDIIEGCNNYDGRYIFDNILNDCPEHITVFDFIFCKKGGLTSPDTDLIELSGVKKSKLHSIKNRIENIASIIYAKRKNYFGTDKNFNFFSIENSLRNIIGDPIFDSKSNKVKYVANAKYQSHILKVIPQIYMENYHIDDVLINYFVSNVEFSIRAGDQKYEFLKFDLEFLLSIQNNKINKYMEIINSDSYAIGLLLGSLAKNLSKEINSFEKNYVGNLTRRIVSIEDFIKLKNDIEQKLIMHDKSRYTATVSYDLAQKIKEFKSQYDKEECAFGFFESYFKPLKKKEDNINE